MATYRTQNPKLRKFYETCIELARDNFSEFYIPPANREAAGPRYPRQGAGHRCAFWIAYQGKPNYRFDPGSFAYAAFRAGQDFKRA